jgi:hemolysin activation/secretion protein
MASTRLIGMRPVSAVVELNEVAFKVPGKAIRMISLIAVSSLILSVNTGARAQDAVAFEIKEFNFKGNTLFSNYTLKLETDQFTGKDKRVEDVEAARSAVERFHHKKGYPTVLVNIPEQTVESGYVTLEVIESKVRRVRVTGNRYFTREKLLKELPAFRPGTILYLPEVQKQLDRINRNPDLKVAPVLMPGKKLGTIDVEFKVKDKLPLHGSLEINNRSTHETTNLRLNAAIRYDNLWQKEHAVGVQFQTSPKDTDEVKLVAGSYVIPSPFSDEDIWSIYGIWSDSDTATGDGITVLGSGYIIGTRYLMRLPPYESYNHDITIGLDYKNFEEAFETDTIPIDYLPLYLGYDFNFPDAWGETYANVGLNLALRGVVSSDEDFDTKRSGASGNYIYFAAAIVRQQQLPNGMELSVALDGQVADQPLVSNEQYIAGGMFNVRGYKESEATGDSAVHGIFQLNGPEIMSSFDWWDQLEFTPYVFYDFARLFIQDPSEGEDQRISLAGTGIGTRGYVFKSFEYRFDWGVALKDTDRTEAGDSLFHFIFKYAF